MRWLALLALCGCGADLLNNAAIHAHIDETPDAQPISRATTSFELLVPIWGSYMMERRAYGNVRPSGIVFDWILGGLVPAVLVGTSFAVHDAGTRSTLRWSALGLYAGTRVGVEIIGNLHVGEFNDYLAERKQIKNPASPRGSLDVPPDLSWGTVLTANVTSTDSLRRPQPHLLIRLQYQRSAPWRQ